MKFIVVESPTKAVTLKKFLGKEYEVQSSLGHIRDLPKDKIGIDVEHDFAPSYIIPTKARKTVTSLKNLSKKAQETILASVDYEEPTLIQYPDGLVRMEKVGKFIDWILDSHVSPLQFRVAAFSSDSHKISFKQIKHVVRHPVKEKLIKIRTEYGHTITVTPSHSLFQKNRDGSIKTVAGKNLKEGDSLLAPISIPRGEKDLSEKRIDILKAIYENEELRNNVFIKSMSIAEYRKSQLLAPRKGNTPQLFPRIFFANAFRNNLQKYRSSQGWSQKILAEKIGCSQSDISGWEDGQGHPTLDRGKRYLSALGLSMDRLVAEKELSVGPSSIEQAIAQALETQWRDSRKSKSRGWQPLSWFTWEELEQHFSDDETIEISRSNHSHRMPRFILINHDLMLFLGFFTAEGSFLTHGKYARFSFGSKTHAAENTHIQSIREASQRLFNLTPSDFAQKTGHSVVLNSTLVTFFLKEIMGIKRGAYNKEVPHPVFNVSPVLQFSFLKGCFLGDGTLGKGGITFNTISPSLASGISYILLQNGILSSHSLAISKKPNRKPLHQITITGKEKVTTALPIWQDHYRAQPLKEYCARNRNLKQSFSLAKEKSGDCALLRVKNIEEVQPSNHYVYDFSVEGENFVCGNGGVCAHNTDEDREGEAIAWHIAEVLGLKDPKRIVFHEITKEAINEALQHPRTIDMNRVDAQQARRILDRLVGYKLSPFLWKKIARGLSAGRVQSVAVRLVSDREREIQAFKPQEYWSIEALLQSRGTTQNKTQNNAETFTAILIKKDEKTIGKLDIKSKEEADTIVKNLQGANYTVATVEKRETRHNPLPPFMTSTLQQEAWKRLRFPARATMSVAQHLYETGFITYHRTDSVNLSEFSLQAAQAYIINTYGEQYWPGSPRIFKGRAKGAQEAHEAIRPAFAEASAGKPTFPAPESLKVQKKLDPRSFKLYDLVWRRFMASQMSQAAFDSTAVEIEAEIRNPKSEIRNYTFRATGQTLKFDGFLKVYSLKFTETELPALKENELLALKELVPSQHFTEPSPRYTEATLIKALEEHGIGRPSTYAPTLSTIQDRGYIEKDEQKKFKPTDLGFMVNDVLVQHFPKIVDIAFTADMEEKLDKIAQGEKEWVPTMREFYTPFEENLTKKYEEVIKKDIITETTDKTCPTCGSPLVVRMGRFGKFYACSTFPKCRYTENMQQEKMDLGIPCPSCKKGEVVRKLTRTRKTFYGCNTYPACTFALWQKPTGETCTLCGSLLVETGKDVVKCSNKECKNSK